MIFTFLYSSLISMIISYSSVSAEVYSSNKNFKDSYVFKKQKHIITKKDPNKRKQ